MQKSFADCRKLRMKHLDNSVLLLSVGVWQKVSAWYVLLCLLCIYISEIFPASQTLTLIPNSQNLKCNCISRLQKSTWTLACVFSGQFLIFISVYLVLLHFEFHPTPQLHENLDIHIGQENPPIVMRVSWKCISLGKKLRRH